MAVGAMGVPILTGAEHRQQEGAPRLRAQQAHRRDRAEALRWAELQEPVPNPKWEAARRARLGPAERTAQERPAAAGHSSVTSTTQAAVAPTIPAVAPAVGREIA